MERDNSYNAILERYRKANELSIVSSDRITFDSLRDVYHLVSKCKGLEEELQKAKAELITLTSVSK